ncbi:hypothetical protein B0H16DRAFT_1742580 [Mycena metata]|uniref:CxC2-like cysteine cluster KDZ transposase-associated domain-containing protein n=1 Tax=Mycena metata TaxID=1033252 RepID=A0AAD7MEX8_9AGAR|nr:hypothetical protein B0H16DRAFT_1742580 [Mycena metata]
MTYMTTIQILLARRAILYRHKNSARGLKEIQRINRLIAQLNVRILALVAQWLDGVYEPTPNVLKALGVQIHLGHDGSHCPSASAQQDFQIITSDGMNDVALFLCGCPDAKAEREQLIDAGFTRVTRFGPRVLVLIEYARHIARLVRLTGVAQK